MYQQLLDMHGNITDWVRRLEDGACVQIQNKEYQEWLDEGGVPLPADE
jgi:hypothetical protein